MEREGVISDHDRKQFRIPWAEGLPPISINPDLVVYLPGKEKVEIEVVNPSKPKRFIGEMVYSHILKNLGIIEAAIFIVLPTPKSRRSERDMVQEMMMRFLGGIFRKKLHHTAGYLDTEKLEDTYYLRARSHISALGTFSSGE